jgi:hypothetical protein
LAYVDVGFLEALYTQTKVVLHKEKDKIIENQNNQSGKS